MKAGTPTRSLLALLAAALLQAILPPVVYAHLANGNALMRDVCDHGGHPAHAASHAESESEHPDAATGSADGLCVLCVTAGAAALPVRSQVFVTPTAIGNQPTGQRLHAAGAAALIPPATGPPAHS